MLDIKFIRENAERVQSDAEKKGYQNINIADLLKLDEKRRDLQGLADELRAEKNEISAQMKGGKPSEDLIKKATEVKKKLQKIEEDLQATEKKTLDILKKVPNVLADDVPVGGEELSVELKTWGEKRIEKIDHLDWANKRELVDFERGAKVAGTKFYFLKNELALLENALLQFGLQKVLAHGFNFMTVPHMVNSDVATGTGFAPRSDEQSDEYFIENEDLSLIATAEMAITGYHAGEIIDEKDLPIFYAGYSACYRKEAGAAGKHNRGLFRVHQFNKLEMYAFTTPEQSFEIHEKLREIEEEIWQELQIPYHIINIASGDLGAPATKKYDLEYWSPVDEAYRELTSCSNCTDFQARNLNIRVRKNDGSIETLHTLNGTAISMARALVAIIENYGNADGTLTVPEVLKPYLSNKNVL